MSNRRKLNLAKLARVMAGNVRREVAALPADLRPGQTVRLTASGVLSETVEPLLAEREPEER